MSADYSDLFRKTPGARGLYSGWDPLVRIVKGFRREVRPTHGALEVNEEVFLGSGRVRRSSLVAQIGRAEYVRRVGTGEIREPHPPR